MEGRAGAAEEDVEDAGGATPGELVTFLLSAPKRRKKLARIVFAATFAAGIVAALLKPRAYISEVRILAQRNGTMKEVATHSTRDESPTKSVAESILRRDNLLAIMDDTKLMERWNQDRAPLLRAKDKVMSLVLGPIKEEDKQRAIVGILEKHLYVNADDTTITIGVDWPTAQTAYAIVHSAEQRFLDARQESEVGMISDAITILESHLTTERENLDAAVVELQRLEDQKKNGVDPSPSSAPSASPSGEPSGPPHAKHTIHVSRPQPAAAPTADPAMKKELQEKQRAIEDLENARQRKLADFNSQLTTMRATLAPAHPSIVALEREIDSVSRPSDEVNGLKAEVAQLKAQLGDETPIATMSPSGGGSVDSSGERDAGAPSPLIVVDRTDDDAATALAKQKMTNATLKYDELQSRIRAAKIELDVAEAAFKYKYSIITPAEVPRDPKKPSPALIAIFGIVAAFFFYFLVPAALDLLSGRVVASWQARRLGIPILGEVEPPEI